MREQVRCLKARLEMQNKTHPLTGLLLNTWFYSETEEILRRNPREHYCILCLDIEHFNLYNELHGYEAGDKLLSCIGKSLNELARRHEGLAGYMGEDDFMLLLPWAEKENGLSAGLMEQLHGLCGTDFFLVAGAYGIRDRSLSVTQICDRAHVAASFAKGGYAFRFVWFEERMQQSLLQEQELIREAHCGLEQDEFVLYVQPQCRLCDGKVVSAEALVRWNHPRKGLLLPEAFIPVFEKTGFIARLDAFVWERACQYLRRWLDAGLSPLPLTVNVSRLNLLSEANMPLHLATLFRRYKIDPSLFSLEITETAYVKNYDSLIRSISCLKSMGVRILMDDFGHGYSSLSTLQDMKLDAIKLDMRLLDTTTDGRLKSADLLKSVLRFAKGRHIQVIAEGLQTADQADFLRSIGCECAQGYLLYRPMPIESFSQLFGNVERADPIAEPPPLDACCTDAFAHLAESIAAYLEAAGIPNAKQELHSLAENIPATILVIFPTEHGLTYRVVSLGSLAQYADGSEKLEAYLNAAVESLDEPMPAILQDCKEQLRRAYETAASLDTDFCAGASTKEPRWFNLKGKRLMDPFGVPVFLCVLMDITRLKNQDLIPWLSCKQFHNAIQQAGLHIWEYDYKSRDLCLMCAEDCELPDLGFPLMPNANGDLILQDFPALFDRESAALSPNGAALLRVWEELHDAEHMQAQCRFINKEDIPFWIEICGEFLAGADGQPLRAIGYIRDITAEKERQQEQQATQLLLQKLEEGSLCNLRVNLSNDTVLRTPSATQFFNNIGIASNTSYSQCVLFACSVLILPPFQKQARLFLDRQRLLEAFDMGENSGRMEYQQFLDGASLWCRLDYHMARQDETGDVYGYFFIKDIEARKQHEQMLKQRAETDAQSGLFNRQAGRERILAALSHTVQTGGTAGLLMCDLDDFKRINDTWGHAYGDEAIVDTGRLLRRIFNGADVLCRIGGDEFLAFCPGASRKEMENKAMRLCAGAKEIRVGDHGVFLSLSAGIVMIPEHGVDLGSLYPMVDAMLYLAKANGKSTYCFAKC